MQRCLRLFISCVLLIGLSGPVLAQTSLLPSGSKKSGDVAVELPDPLTEQAIHSVLSELDDKQVRALLLKRLKADAEKRKHELAAQDNRGLEKLAADYAMSFRGFIGDVLVKAPNIPSSVSRAITNYGAGRAAVPLSNVVLSLIACLGLGLAGALAFARLTGSVRQRIEKVVPVSLSAKMKWLSLRFALQVSAVLVFAVVALALSAAWNGRIAADRETVNRIVTATAWTWFAVLVARFLLSPTNAQLRLCDADDPTASFLTRRVGLMAAIYCFGFGFVRWMTAFGVAYDQSWIGFWVNLVLHLVIGITIWQARAGITAMFSDRSQAGEVMPTLFARWWPTISIALVTLHWLLVELVVATSSVPVGLFAAMTATLAVIVGLPMLEHAIRAVTAGFVPKDQAKEAALQAADGETRTGLVRIARVVVASALVVVLLRLWGVEIVKLAEQGMGARFAKASIDSALIVLVAYGLWEGLRIVTDRQIAYEQVALGINPNADAMADGEGGGAGARLGTLLPLVKLTGQVAIVVMSVLAILGQLGVNILPLLAGAGIVGLAIGFGAQTLVKDIISGVFFLIDDAFRKGEYIDIGNVKGTVERISIRSMQLRHHNGPLNTVPFGDIRHVTNFSRDWVMMKLPLRLTYDTDAEKVRKMIKRLGEEMLEDPNLGPLFLQPLKSQGVIQMEDSAMIMRVKFMTRPGDQWGVRRVVYARIRDLFEQNGIKFANREVTVRLAEGGAERRPLDRETREAVAGGAARQLTET
jgi:moderate conductance mechanosensitive channel